MCVQANVAHEIHFCNFIGDVNITLLGFVFFICNEVIISAKNPPKNHIHVYFKRKISSHVTMPTSADVVMETLEECFNNTMSPPCA